jgi:RHS repeat-associated protein
VYEQGGGGGALAHNYYHADGNGNVTCLVDNNQAIVASYKYDPYGRTISSSGSLAAANIYRFSSKELHAKSGMYYYLYRFYDPNTQRWLNRDPIGEWEPGGINLYNYVANAPIANVDKDGLRIFGGLPPGGISGPFRPPGPSGPSIAGAGISFASALLGAFADCSGKCPRSSCESCCKTVYAASTALNAGGAVVGCLGSGGLLCILNGAAAVASQISLNHSLDECMTKCQSKRN